MFKTIITLMVLLQACTSNPPETQSLIKSDVNDARTTEDFLARFNRLKSIKEVTEISRKSGKSAVVIFTGHSCIGCKKQEQSLLSSNEIQEMLLQNFHCYIAHVDDKTLSEQHSSTYGAYYRELQLELFESEEIPSFLLIQQDGNITIRKQAFQSVVDFTEWLELSK
jgi:thioredoxin-related protein